MSPIKGFRTDTHCPVFVDSSPATLWHFLCAARYLSPEALDAVEGLIDDLDLEFFGAEKVEGSGDDMPP